MGTAAGRRAAGRAVRDSLRSVPASVQGKHVMVGFDGFVDELYRVVKEKHGGSPPSHFSRLTELGGYISARGGASLSLELESLALKIGGNGPILGNALSRLGLTTDIVAPVGYPSRIDLFTDHETRTYHSYGMPGRCIALEFGDGKMLLADMASLNSLEWPTVVDRIGTDVLTALARSVDAVALVNWGELDHASSMWHGLLNDYVSKVERRDRIFMFDLSDSARRSDAEHRDVAGIIRSYSRLGRTVISLNENEASLLARAVGQDPAASRAAIAGAIGTLMELECAVIHGADAAVAWTRLEDGAITSVPTIRAASPVLTTGGGDNFNAGLLLGLLLGYGIEDALLVGNAVATCYVRDGVSPTVRDLIDYLDVTATATRTA